MCRKRPGPRCSDEGKHRYDRARLNLARAESMRGGRELSDLTARQRVKYFNAQHRFNAARLVYYATPSGQNALRDSIDAHHASLEGLRGRRSRDAIRERAAHTQAITDAEVALEEGIARRANSYADLKLAGDERKELRDQSFARGGHMGAQGQRLVDPAVIERRREQTSDAPVTLREWTMDDTARANSWVEHEPKVFDNPNAPAPGRSARNDEGQRVRIGSAIEGVNARSVLLRVNSPDGSVTEGRHDWHVTQNDDGKFVVSRRSSVATSWEDASPIDVTRQELGHMLSDSHSSRADLITVYGTYDSERGAKIARGHAVRNHNGAQTTAMMGRDALVLRAGSSSENDTQVRGVPVWHRFREDSSGSGMSRDN